MSTYNQQDNTPAQKQSDAVSATTTQESTQISISNASDTNSHSCISSTKPDPVSNFISTFITNIQKHTDNNAALQTEFLKVIQNFTFDKKITITEKRISAEDFRAKMEAAVNSVGTASENYISHVKNAIANAIAHTCGFKNTQDQDKGDIQSLHRTINSSDAKDTDVWFANKCLDLINEVTAIFAAVSDKTVNTNVTGDVTCNPASQDEKVSKADLKEIIDDAISSALEAKNYGEYIDELMDKIEKYFKSEAVSVSDNHVAAIKAAIDPVAEDSTKILEDMKDAVKKAIAKENQFTDYDDIDYVQRKADAAAAVKDDVGKLPESIWDVIKDPVAKNKGFLNYDEVTSILAKAEKLEIANETISAIEKIINDSATLFEKDIKSKPDYLKKVIEIVKDAIADKMLDSTEGYVAVTNALDTNPKDAKAQAAEKAINDVTSKLALVAPDLNGSSTSANDQIKTFLTDELNLGPITIAKETKVREVTADTLQNNVLAAIASLSTADQTKYIADVQRSIKEEIAKAAAYSSNPFNRKTPFDTAEEDLNSTDPILREKAERIVTMATSAAEELEEGVNSGKIIPSGFPTQTAITTYAGEFQNKYYSSLCNYSSDQNLRITNATILKSELKTAVEDANLPNNETDIKTAISNAINFIYNFATTTERDAAITAVKFDGTDTPEQKLAHIRGYLAKEAIYKIFADADAGNNLTTKASASAWFGTGNSSWPGMNLIGVKTDCTYTESFIIMPLNTNTPQNYIGVVESKLESYIGICNTSRNDFTSSLYSCITKQKYADLLEGIQALPATLNKTDLAKVLKDDVKTFSFKGEFVSESELKQAIENAINSITDEKDYVKQAQAKVAETIAKKYKFTDFQDLETKLQNDDGNSSIYEIENAKNALEAINEIQNEIANFQGGTTLTKDYKVALNSFSTNWRGETLYGPTTNGACTSTIAVAAVTNDDLKAAIDKALTNWPNTPIDLTKYTFENVTNIVPELEDAIKDVPTASQNYIQDALIATKAVLDSEYVVVHKAKTALDYMMISSVNKVAAQNTLQMLANKFMAVADNTTTKLQAILSNTEQALKTFNVQQLFGPSQSAYVTTENDCATEAECKITSIEPLPHSSVLELHQNPSAYEYTLQTDDPNNKIPIEGNISTINCDYALFNGIYPYYGSNEIKILFRLNSAFSDISPLTFDGLPRPTKENVYNYMKNAETQPILPTLKFYDGQIISTEKSYVIPENCLDGTAQTCAISDDLSKLKYVELRYTDYVMLSQDNNDPKKLTVTLFNEAGEPQNTIENVLIQNMDTNHMITTGLKQDGNNVLWSLHSSKSLEKVSPFKGVSQAELTKEYINTMAAGSASYVITKNFLNTCFAHMQVAKVIYQQACNSDPRCAIDEIIPGVINNEALKSDQYIKFNMLAQDLYTLELCTLSTKPCHDTKMVGKFIHANEYFLLFVQDEKGEDGILLKINEAFNGQPNVKLGCKDAGLWENSLYDECWMAGYEKPNNYGLDLFTVDATKCNTFEL